MKPLDLEKLEKSAFKKGILAGIAISFVVGWIALEIAQRIYV